MRLLIIWNAVITLALVLLFFTFQYPTTEKGTEIEKSAENIADSAVVSIPKDAKIAFINTDSLFKQLSMYKDMEEDLVAERLKAENRYRGEAQKLEKDYNNLRDKAPYMTQAQGEIEQAKLMAKRDELLKMEEDLSANLAEKESRSLQKIKATLEDFLERYNRDKGYHYILGKSQIGGILYAEKALDITPEIVAGLNSEYNSTQEKQ
jgi:outer membrane protein